ncbi:MAG: hypothetical protein KDC71_01625 [Acidobacteria bacterium]|nr:hypothetical protein [Acidobacteriota bacterium]
MELSDELKALLRELGSALHHALTRDETVKKLTDQIKLNGYDIYLIMEANIALDKREDEQPGQLYLRSPNLGEDLAIHFNEYDEAFLSSLKIKPNDD